MSEASQPLAPAPDPTARPAAAGGGRKATLGRRVGWTLAIVFALSGLAASIGLRAPAHLPAGLEGQVAPGFDLPLVGAGPVAADDAAARGRQPAASGRPTLLHFWSTSCAPCDAEAPAVDALVRAAAAGGYEVLTITADTAQDVRSWLAARGYDWPVGFDAAGTVHRDYRVSAIPRSFAIAADRAVVVDLSGPQTADALRAAIAAAQAAP